MCERNKFALGTFQATFLVSGCLKRELELLREGLENYTSSTMGSIPQAVTPLLLSLLESSDSVRILGEKGRMRDSMVLGRVIFETALNAAFILAEGETDASRAFRHATQECLRHHQFERDLVKRFTGEGIPIDPRAEPPSEVEEALHEYASSRGREIRQPTQESIRHRISLVGSKYGSAVQKIFDVALTAFYLDSSEIAHGSLFGAMFASGRFSLQAQKGLHGVHDHVQSYIALTLYCAVSLLHAILMILSIELDQVSLEDASKENVSQTFKIFWPEKEHENA